MDSQTPTLRFEDIVSAAQSGQPSSERVSPRSRAVHPGVNRRGFLKVLAASGFGAGVAMLGIFPQIREVRADGYDIASNCNGISYSDCVSCCCSTVCSHCCTSTKWHKDSGYTNYALRPNVCKGSGGLSGKDGWIWHVCPCGADAFKYRCHDGYYYGYGEELKTICVKSYGCVP